MFLLIERWEPFLKNISSKSYIIINIKFKFDLQLAALALMILTRQIFTIKAQVLFALLHFFSLKFIKWITYEIINKRHKISHWRMSLRNRILIAIYSYRVISSSKIYSNFERYKTVHIFVSTRKKEKNNTNS